MLRFYPPHFLNKVDECLSNAPIWQTNTFVVLFIVAFLCLVMGIFLDSETSKKLERFSMWCSLCFVLFLLADVGLLMGILYVNC